MRHFAICIALVFHNRRARISTQTSLDNRLLKGKERALTSFSPFLSLSLVWKRARITFKPMDAPHTRRTSYDQCDTPGFISLSPKKSLFTLTIGRSFLSACVIHLFNHPESYQ
ncbi:hypothetical protein FRC18_008377 [Serendipita sp. 400]|nr:hypothetical protein FRC18_008377 [Serendipita sp. 400]